MRIYHEKTKQSAECPDAAFPTWESCGWRKATDKDPGPDTAESSKGAS